MRMVYGLLLQEQAQRQEKSGRQEPVAFHFLQSHCFSVRLALAAATVSAPATAVPAKRTAVFFPVQIGKDPCTGIDAYAYRRALSFSRLRIFSLPL